jgi:hypothetical protein
MYVLARWQVACQLLAGYITVTRCLPMFDAVLHAAGCIGLMSGGPEGGAISLSNGVVQRVPDTRHRFEIRLTVPEGSPR